MKKMVLIFMAVAMLFTFSMCASTGNKASELVALKVTPENAKVKVGKAVDLTVKGYDKQGKEIAVTPFWDLRKADLKLGILDNTATETVKFIGKAKGTAHITVMSGNLSVETTVIVTK